MIQDAMHIQTISYNLNNSTRRSKIPTSSKAVLFSAAATCAFPQLALVAVSAGLHFSPALHTAATRVETKNVPVEFPAPPLGRSSVTTQQQKEERMETTDEKLFEQYLAGDESAFNTLHGRYLSDLGRFVAKKVRCDESSRDEIVQMAFIKVVRFRDKFDLSKSFRTWLFAITDRLCRDWMKSASRRRKHTVNFVDSSLYQKQHKYEDTPIADILADERQTPASDALSASEDAQKAVALLNRLPKHLRATVQLMVLNDVPSRAAGPLLGVSHAQAQKRFLAWLATIGTISINLQCSFCGAKHAHLMADSFKAAFMFNHWKHRPMKCPTCCLGRLQVKE
jgi:RNA polymerase sigma factor (sigma-70 family)